MSPGDGLDVPVVAITHQRGRTVRWVVAGIGIVLVGLVVVLASADAERSRQGERALVGSIAPLIAGPTLDGSSFDLDEQQGRWVVVNFFASWCAPCRQEHPELVEFARRHAGGDAVLVTVAMSDDPSDVEDFFDELGGDWPIVAVDTTPFVIDYAVTAPPTTFVVSPTGVIVESLIGRTTADQLDAIIAAFEGEPT